MEARRAHNPEVGGSSPPPATKEKHHPNGWCFLWLWMRHFSPTGGFPEGSEPTAAGGGRKEASEWQRSKKSRKSVSPKIFSGTATGKRCRARAIHYGAIATGNRPILIRCALQHLPCVPLPAALTMALEHLNVESMPLCKEKNR